MLACSGSGEPNDDNEDAIHPSQPAPHSAISRLKKEDHPAKFAPLPNGGSECGAYKLRQRLALTSSVKGPAMPVPVPNLCKLFGTLCEKHAIVGLLDGAEGELHCFRIATAIIHRARPLTHANFHDP